MRPDGRTGACGSTTIKKIEDTIDPKRIENKIGYKIYHTEDPTQASVDRPDGPPERVSKWAKFEPKHFRATWAPPYADYTKAFVDAELIHLNQLRFPRQDHRDEVLVAWADKHRRYISRDGDMFSSDIGTNGGAYYSHTGKLEAKDFRKFYIKKTSEMVALQRFGHTWWSIARMHQYQSGQQQEAEAASLELQNINGYLRRIAKKHDDATRRARAPKAPADTNEAPRHANVESIRPTIENRHVPRRQSVGFHRTNLERFVERSQSRLGRRLEVRQKG